MAKFILENKVVYDSGNHSLFYIDQLDTQVTLAIPASLCLLAMLNKKNETVSLDELLNFAWSSRGMNVSLNAIYQNVSLLRKSLIKFGLTKDFIKTVPKRGFVVHEDRFSIFDNNQVPEVSLDIVDDSSSKNIFTIKSESEGRYVNLSRNSFFIFATLLMSLTSFYIPVLATKSDDITIPPYILPEINEIKSVNDCHIFINKSRTSDKFFNGFISEKMLKCENQKWWYIFNYPPATQTLVLRCNSNLLSKKEDKNTLCKSDYYY